MATGMDSFADSETPFATKISEFSAMEIELRWLSASVCCLMKDILPHC